MQAGICQGRLLDQDRQTSILHFSEFFSQRTLPSYTHTACAESAYWWLQHVASLPEQLSNFPSHLLPLHVRYQVSSESLQWTDAVNPSDFTQAPCGAFISGQPTAGKETRLYLTCSFQVFLKQKLRRITQQFMSNKLPHRLFYIFVCCHAFENSSKTTFSFCFFWSKDQWYQLLLAKYELRYLSHISRLFVSPGYFEQAVPQD